MHKRDQDDGLVEYQAVIESFGEDGEGPSYIRLPFLNSSAECHPLDIEVFLDAGTGADDGIVVGKTNIAKESIEAFGSDPEHYQAKARAMAAALRELADRLESLAYTPRDGLTVHEIGLPPRVANRLDNEGIQLVADLLRHSALDLRKMPDIGRTAIAAISKSVQPFGGLSEKSIRHDERILAREALLASRS